MLMWCFIYLFICIIFLSFNVSVVIAVDAPIKWRPYVPKHLKPQLKDFYTETWDAMIEVPLEHPNEFNDFQESEKHFQIYVRRFSHVRSVKKHLWLISGGPGSSTSGIERALSIRLPDTAVYIMDNRGLGHSNRLCHHSDGPKCQKNPKACYEALDFAPRFISMHETAQDYNLVSRKLKEMFGGEVFMYGSSYGATLAYSAFKFDTQMYSGILLEAFVPEFRLNAHADVRRHLIKSCLKSETCRSALSRISEAEAINLMKLIMDQDTSNPCKSSIAFLSGQTGQNINSFLNSYIRVALYKKTKLRPVIIPLLYSIAYCPNVTRFNRLLCDFHAARVDVEGNTRSKDTLSDDSVTTPTGLHCSLTPNINEFFGNHIRYSEYSYEDEGKFELCQTQKYLNPANWTDVCGMVSDYNDAFTPYLYEPLVPSVSNRELKQSPTRLVIVTGKLDAQTPHDLALQEFNSIPVRNKYLFSADHAGHGIIGSWEVPGLTIDLVLSFTMNGHEDTHNQIERAIRNHNAQAETIWKSWDVDAFGNRDIWDLRRDGLSGDGRGYWWWGFWSFLAISLLPPLLTLILIYDTTDTSEGKNEKTIGL